MGILTLSTFLAFLGTLVHYLSTGSHDTYVATGYLGYAIAVLLLAWGLQAIDKRIK